MDHQAILDASKMVEEIRALEARREELDRFDGSITVLLSGFNVAGTAIASPAIDVDADGEKFFRGSMKKWIDERIERLNKRIKTRLGA